MMEAASQLSLNLAQIGAWLRRSPNINRTV
jgi:hypothetical protein